MKEPRYSGPALQDYLDIAGFISRDNPRAAAQLVERIEAECRDIVRSPESGLRHDSLPARYLVRMVGVYLIIYESDQDGPIIVRIVHGARDLPRMFTETE